MALPTVEQWRARIQKKLVIVMEFAPPEIYQTNFQSGLDLYQEQDMSIDIPPRTTKGSLKKFVNKDLLRQDGGGYKFISWDTIYSTIFDMVQALASFYPYTEIFTHLSWQEYEILITQALNGVGYDAFRTFRFKSPDHRFEIDCVARSNRHVLFIDAKRWKNATISRTRLIKAIKQQHKRVSTLITIPDQLASCGSIFKHDPQIPKLEIYILVLVASDMAENLIMSEGVALPFARFNHFLKNFHEFTEILSPIEYYFPDLTKVNQTQVNLSLPKSTQVHPIQSEPLNTKKIWQ
ncbi:MAG: hypothetical protein ACTSYI_02605 [Promethearchaeota archaeon]